MITLFILLFTSVVRSLIVYDVIYIEPYFKFGMGEISYGVENLRVDSKYPCDKLGWFHHAKCDMTAFGKMCYIHERVPTAEIGYYMSLKEPSFVIDYDFHSKDTYRRYVICDKLSRHDYPDNTNYNMQRIILGTYFGPLSMYIHYTTLFGEREFDSNLWYSFHVPFFPFARQIYSVHIAQKKDFFKKAYHWSYGFYGYTHSTIYMRAQCAINYFGMDCWYLCNNDFRHTCSCHGYGDYLNLLCNITCKPGYLTLTASYRLISFRETLVYCEITDKCYRDFRCPIDQLCLPINNSTADCAWIVFIITSPWEKNNITSNVFFKYEIITISYIVKKSKPEYLVNSSLQIYFDWLVDHKIIEIGNTDREFEIIGPYSNYEYQLDFKFTFNDWYDKFIARSLYIMINELPTDVAMYSAEGEIISYYIYLNESIYCNGSGKPPFRVITYWTFSCCISIFPFQNQFSVNITSLTKYTKIGCTTYMFAYNRTTFTKSVYKYVFIKVYRYFDWTDHNNVYESNDVLVCKATAYLDHYLSIIQIEGLTELVMKEKLIYLKGALGGFYKLICLLRSLVKFAFMKTKAFELRLDPTLVCLFFYPSVPGYIIQCGHNGYIPDEYNIIITLYILKANQYDLHLSADTYLRLPYTAQVIKYEIVCNVTSDIGREFKKILYWKDATFLDIEHEYIMTKENKECSTTAPYIENPDIVEYTKTGIIISHKLMTLSNIFSVVAYQLILSILIICIPALSVLAIVFIIVDLEHSSSTKVAVVNRTRRLMCGQMLHSAIIFQSQHLKHPTYRELGFDFFKTPTFSNYDLSRELSTVSNTFKDNKKLKVKR